jgi:hypothetical protein
VSEPSDLLATLTRSGPVIKPARLGAKCQIMNEGLGARDFSENQQLAITLR